MVISGRLIVHAPVQLAAGQVLLHNGAESSGGQQVFFCYRGQLAVVKHLADDDNEQLINMVGRGGCVGEWAAISGHTRPTISVVATAAGAALDQLGVVELFVLSAEAFMATADPRLISTLERQKRGGAAHNAELHRKHKGKHPEHYSPVDGVVADNDARSLVEGAIDHISGEAFVAMAYQHRLGEGLGLPSMGMDDGPASAETVDNVLSG